MWENFIKDNNLTLPVEQNKETKAPNLFLPQNGTIPEAFTRSITKGISYEFIKTLETIPNPIMLVNFSYTDWIYNLQETRIIDKHMLIIDLPKNMPYMVLDPFIDPMKYTSVYPQNHHRKIKEYDSSKRLPLPANMDDIFKGYNITGTENDFYYIFSPDVLETIITYAKDIEICIIDNKLYLIGSDTLYTYDIDAWKYAEKLVQTVGKQIIEQVNRWNM